MIIKLEANFEQGILKPFKLYNVSTIIMIAATTKSKITKATEQHF